MLPNSKLPLGVRLTVFSYLNNKDLLTATTLCKYDRKQLQNSHIVCAGRSAHIDITKIKDPSALINMDQPYLWSLFPSFTIAAHNILPQKLKPEAFAQFFVNLPESFEHQKVSLSISGGSKSPLEDFFSHLWTEKCRFAFKTLQINFDSQSKPKS